MTHKFKSVISILLVLVFLQSCFSIGSYATVIGDGTASSWAEKEIKEAVERGLTYDGIMNNFTKPITREEFCVIVVKLYEKISGRIAEGGQNPFNDTTNPEIIKAYLLGIVKGTGAGKFSPDKNITRQELCVMIQRALEVSVPNLSTEAPALKGYKDTGKIAPWAGAAVRFSINNEIIRGVGSGMIDPLGNTTREQAIAILKRTFDRYKTYDVSSLPILDVSNNPQSLFSETEKFSRLDTKNRVSIPPFDTRLILYAATGQGKPKNSPPDVKAASISGGLIRQPVTPNIIETNIIETNPIKKYFLRTDLRYTTTPFTFIDSSGDLKRYFAFSLGNANASKVIWQVSKTPFNGYPPNWRNPSGLVASGEVAATSREFVVDFSKFALQPTPPSGVWQLNAGQLVFKTINTYREIPREQRTYYVRAVPVDSRGNCIEDPGTGLPVIYGKPVPDKNLAIQIQPSFELWFPERGGTPTSGGEFPNLYIHDTSRVTGVYPSNSEYCFQPRKFDVKASTLILQVSTIPFKNEPARWDKPSGLVYQKKYDVNNMPSVYNFENSLTVKFAAFGPTSAELGTKKIIYYVRAVTVKPSDSQPGTVVPEFSDTLAVQYSNPDPVKIYETKTVTVPAYTPAMTFQRYIPVRWEDPEWINYYEVFRAPRWYEVNFKLKTSSGNILYPYSHYMLQGMSASDYENKLVPQFLVEGSGFKVVAKQAEKSWWGDLWDGIVNFFSSIARIISDVVNWASSTFNSLKMGIINIVAANFPLIPSEWRDELALALTMLADYGLASIGIPPNLPNFDELMSGGLDYAISVAAQEAGIPANALTDAGKSKLAEEIKQQAKTSTSVMGPNPLNCAFIKPDHRYQYRPAYIDLKLYNNNPKPSPTGTLRITVEDKKWPYFPVYDNVSIPVPSLEPHQSMPIRVYLKEYMNKPYPGDVPYIPKDFYDMYWGKDGKKCKFSIGITYNLPDAKQAAKAMGLDQNQGDYILNYEYDKPCTGYGFTGVPSEQHF